VAVLPLENRARDTALVLLAEGLADQITTDLGGIARIDVAPPASVRFVLGRGPRDPARLARALNVRWLVDGQFLPDRGRVRVSVQLIDATAQRVRWSGAFQRPTDDVFAVITGVADSVATAIVGTLAPAEHERIARRPTASNAAALAYARGVALLHRYSEESVREAAGVFDDAIAADSGYAAAWAGLAEAWMWQDWMPPREVFPRARAAAERARALDPASPAALAALASIALYYDWDPPRAESLARRALALDSSRARSWLYLGDALVSQGRVDDGVAALRRAVAADTLDEAVATDASIGLGLARADEALALARRWRQLAPDSPMWDAGEAVALLRMRRCGAEPLPESRTPISLVCAGRREAARAELDTLARGPVTGPDVMALASTAAALGDHEETLRWLARAVDDRLPGAVFLAVEPFWDGVRADPRFAELLRRVRTEPPNARVDH